MGELSVLSPRILQSLMAPFIEVLAELRLWLRNMSSDVFEDKLPNSHRINQDGVNEYYRVTSIHSPHDAERLLITSVRFSC